MKKTKREILYFITFIVIISIIMTACQTEGFTNDDLINSDEQRSIYQHKGLQGYDELIDLSIVGQTSDNIRVIEEQFHNETLENNRWIRLYRDVLDIDIHYEWIVESSLYHQELVNELMSGNLPDLIKVDALQMRQLSDAGLIQDLTAIYDEYATPFTKEVLSQEVINPIEAAMINQKLMGIPVIESSLDKMQFIWIRTDWLENLDLEPPQTMDDLLMIAEKFTHEDPNQTGEDDTYGLALSNYPWNNISGIEGFMAGFNAYPNIWLEDENGQLVYGATQPEVKQALAVLQDMYKDGQIDSEFMFKDGDALKKQVTNNEIGILFGEQWASFYVQENYEEHSEAEWQAFPIVSDTNEVVKMPIRNATSKFWVVNADYDYPEALVKLINLHLEKNWGETAEYDYYYSTPYPIWQLSPVTPFPAQKNFAAYRQLEQARQTGLDSELKGEAKAIHQQIELYLENDDSSGWGWWKTYGTDGAYNIMDEFIKNDQILYDKFIWPQTEIMMEMNTILSNRKLDAYQNIILGEPLSNFDVFVEEWYQIGGQQITNEVNRIYQQNSSE